jgi:hypothetical protein
MADTVSGGVHHCVNALYLSREHNWRFTITQVMQRYKRALSPLLAMAIVACVAELAAETVSLQDDASKAQQPPSACFTQVRRPST